MLITMGCIILLGTVYLMVKQYETRMVLFCSGLLMAALAGDPLAAFKGFTHAMQESKTFEAIVSVMGFAFVLKATECDRHLIHLMVKSLKKAGPLLIPGATLVTFFVNTSVASATGCAAAVGTVMIPFLKAAGVHPAIAASAVFAGCFGNIFNPGFGQNVVLASVVKSDGVAIVANHFMPLLSAGFIVAFSLLVVAWMKKEHAGYVDPDTVSDDNFKVNYLMALVPLLPLLILTLGANGYVPIFKKLTISYTMIIGVFAAFLVTRVSPGKISKEFWHGVGDAFSVVFGIIICALVFVEGMKSIGLVGALVQAMTENTSIAKMSATFGPFILGLISGSGDAAATAFNKAVTVNAAQFGLDGMNMGSVAIIAGALGRNMSPIAGGTVICCAMAGVNPIELAKRNALGMTMACVVTMLIMLY